MTKREELLKQYDDARTELDRANLEAFLIRRRARLAGVPVDAAEVEAARLRCHEADRAVTRALYACKASRVSASRINTQAAREQRRQEKAA